MAPWFVGLGIALVGLASWAATGAVLRLLIARRIYDAPNDRSSHSQPKPRGAGLAVVPVVVAAWGLAALAAPESTAGFWQMIAGTALLGAISWADDLKSQPARLRFGLQVTAVVLGLWGLGPAALVFQGLLPPLVDHLLTALLWLWFINLFNFMDGIDGITAVETISIGAGLALVGALFATAPGEVFYPAALAAAALGFLYWNWAPSRIFLGDVGAIPLGYLVGWLLITTAASGHRAVALILPLYYLCDASWMLTKRIRRREKLWIGHRGHFYQRAVQRGFSHAAVATRILLCNAVLIALALLAAAGQPWIALALALLAVAVLLFILARQAPPAPEADGPGRRPPQQ